MHSSKWNINFYSEIENWNKSQESVRNWQFFHFAISDVSWSAWNMKRNSITCPLSANNNKEKSQQGFLNESSIQETKSTWTLYHFCVVISAPA